MSLSLNLTLVILHSPNTMTKVILIVLTFALGMSPLELALRQSSLLSRAIFLLLASVRGTEMDKHWRNWIFTCIRPHLASHLHPPNTRGHKSWWWGIIVDKSAAISCYPISKVLALGLVLLKECISRLTNRSKIITHSIFSVKNGNTTRKLELKSLRIEIYIPVFWPPSPPPVPEKWGMCKFEKCPCQLNWRKHKCLSSVATSLSVTVACYVDIFRSSS